MYTIDMIQQDVIQRVKVAGLFLLQVYKVTTGTLLSLFVPQSCGDTMCTLSQNYENEDVYHKLCLYWNVFSMITFYSYYFVELKRENWSIEYLDVDNNQPDNHLKQVLKTEPELDKRMDQLNLFYYRTLVINMGVYSVNLGLTIKLLSDNYYNSSTLSCFVSFVLLVMMKLYNSWVVAKESLVNDKMMSAYMSEFISFNILDEDYQTNKENSQEKLEEKLDEKEEEIVPRP